MTGSRLSGQSVEGRRVTPSDSQMPITLAWFKAAHGDATEELLTREAEAILDGSELHGRLSSGAAAPSLTPAVENGAAGNRKAEASAAVGARSVEAVRKLLHRFQRARKDLGKLSQSVDRNLQQLQQEVREEKEAMRLATEGLIAAPSLSSDLSKLETSIMQVGRTASQVGEQLLHAEARRETALEALAIIEHLRQFSICGEDFAQLPPLFHDDETLAEAAGTTWQLLGVAEELAATSARSRDTSAPGIHAGSQRGDQLLLREDDEQQLLQEAIGCPGRGFDVPGGAQTGPPGSIARVVLRLKQYCSSMEERVVARFDEAAPHRLLQDMQECARIMAEFGREDVLINRYISQLPMFLDGGAIGWAAMDGRGLRLTGGGTGNGHAAPAGDPAKQEGQYGAASVQELSGHLGSVFSSILASVKEEVVVLGSVFTPPEAAVGCLVQRVVEQRVRLALESTAAQLEPPDGDPGAAGEASRIQGRLRLLVEMHRRTRELADGMAAVCGPEASVEDRVAGLLAENAGVVPVLENRLAQLRFAELELLEGGCQELSLGNMAQVMDWNRAAIERAMELTPESQWPRCIRLLFHNSATLWAQESGDPAQQRPSADEDSAAALSNGDQAGRAATGCLLGQVSSHVLGGLASAAAACADASERGRARLTSAAAAGGGGGRSAQEAALAVEEGMGRALEAAALASQVVAKLQAYYRDKVQPLVAPVRNEEVESALALAGFLKSAQGAVLRTLRDGLGAFMRQIEAVLASEQHKSEFLPGEAAPLPECPTPACVLATALLKAGMREATGALAGANLVSFLREMAERVRVCLVTHLCRFTYSQTGALRLKHDVGEYIAALAEMWVPSLAAATEAELSSMVSILMISPESLLGVVDGTLRLSRRDALRYVQLRADFKTARVDNRTLAALFASD